MVHFLIDKSIGKIEDKEVIKKHNKETQKEEKIIRREISIIKSKCENILKEGGFNNPTSILSNFKEKDLIDCEADRLSRRRKVSKEGSTIDVIVLKIETPYIETQAMIDKYNNSYKRKKDTKNKKELNEADIREIDEMIEGKN